MRHLEVIKVPIIAIKFFIVDIMNIQTSFWFGDWGVADELKACPRCGQRRRDSEVVRSRKRHDHNMDAEMGTLEEETGEIRYFDQLCESDNNCL